MMGRVRRTLVALAAALALADGSIVVLALPDLAASLDATVEGAAAVIAVYTGVIALTLPLAWAARRRLDPAGLGAGGLLIFAAGSLGCALAGSLGTMLVMRGVQGAGGALAIATAAWMLRADAGGGTWAAIAIAGAAAGPALGGALTQAFDWHAIFVAQIPVAVLAAVACGWPGRAAAAHTMTPARGGVAVDVALGLVSAALTAVLFLLVFVMIAGWSVEPLAAAAALTVLPLAGLASMRIRGGDPRSRATIGALLIAGGIAALAAMNTASVWWAIAPQAMAGAGMGLALPALADAAGGAVRALTIRHVGITVALALLAPLIADRVEHSIQVTRERQVAALLDAPMGPLDKLRLAPRLVKGVDERDPRGALQRELERAAPSDPAKRAAYDRYAEQVDATVVRGVDDAFRPIFWITAALALLAALVLAPRPRPALAYAGAAAVALPAAALVVALAVAPSVPEIQDPCHHRTERPGAGLVERLANEALDRAACERGSSREQLVLDAAERVQRLLDQGGIDAQRLVQQLLD
jgi:MFS family permease